MGAVFGVCNHNEISEAPPTEEEEVTARTSQESLWVKLGGEELEPALRDGLVKCLDSRYLAYSSEPLCRRQDMPEGAYLGLDDLKQIGVQSKTEREGGREVEYQWLPLMIVSYAWLSPNHPDPFGETREVLAKALKDMESIDYLTEVRNGNWMSQHQHGVIIDFTALPQVPRSDADNKTFKLGLPALNRFYSHPHVIVLKVSQLPDGYPGSRPYDLPEGFEPVQYSGRGWCFAEAAMAGLGKSPKFVCDVSRLERGTYIVGGSVVLPQPPLSPEKFNKELRTKKFTQPKSDVARVQGLYRSAFRERVFSAKSLLYANLEWGPPQIALFAEAIAENETVETLDLSHNRLGAEGMGVLAKVLHTQTLKEVHFGDCTLGDEGMRGIGEVLRLNTLTCLNLRSNAIGDAGAMSIGEGLKLNTALTDLSLADNQVGDVGARAVGEGLKLNTALTNLSLRENRIGREGAQAVAEGIKLHSALGSISLGGNQIKDEGARAMGEALKLNSALNGVDLSGNEIGVEGARAIGEALKLNSALKVLFFSVNEIGDEGARAIGEGLKFNTALQLIVLKDTQIGDEGWRAICEGLTINTAYTRLERDQHNITAYGEAGRACVVSLDLEV